MTTTTGKLAEEAIELVAELDLIRISKLMRECGVMRYRNETTGIEIELGKLSAPEPEPEQPREPKREKPTVFGHVHRRAEK